ncbi:MAG: glutathione S-transferase family protein [Acetobacteraceae bacterium]|nr:glutathione S-transferase family protein [Acetobacteraceae bacterium]
MRRLWGRANSANVMKPIWLMEELNLPYERIGVGGKFGRTDTPEYRRMNPTGLVPALEEDGFTLWESNAILRYICNACAPDSPLYPSEPRARGIVDCWMDASQTTLSRPQSVVLWTLVRTPPEQRDYAALQKAMQEADRAWALVEQQTKQHPYVAGDTFTLADIAWGVHVHRWFVLPIERSDAPSLYAWYQRLLQRPAYATHCAGPVT